MGQPVSPFIDPTSNPPPKKINKEMCVKLPKVISKMPMKTFSFSLLLTFADCLAYNGVEPSSSATAKKQKK